MKDIIIEVAIIQTISVILLCIAIFYLIKQSRLTKYEKRIASFSLFSLHDVDKSFFDRIYSFLWNFIKKLSARLKNIKFLKVYSATYDKYILFEERELKSGYDFISIKIILAVILSILSLFTMMFQYTRYNFSIFVIIITIGFFLPDLYLRLQFRKKRKKISDDLLKAIIIMNNAFKSGSNITQAVGIVKDELDGAISDEFQKIYIDINYGLSLDVVFNRFYERVKIDDAKFITSSLSLLNKTGGNIVKVFSLIEKTFFDKKKLRNELNSMTASSIFIFRLLIILPFILVIGIFILNPTYFSPFFNNTIGIICFILIVLLYTLYIIAINRLLKVKI